MITPDMIDLALGADRRRQVRAHHRRVAQHRSEREFEDRNTIKVVIGPNGDALYFSRKPIPTRQRLPFAKIPAYKQVCIIPFRREFLATYTALTPTPLEQAESVDMMRAVEHGYPIRLVKCDRETHSVDTPEDLARVDRLMQGDALIGQYDKRSAR
jgi:3-deoxy-manno-octulosonate cytidylyltransferase (CMP-KDO synthetase)